MNIFLEKGRVFLQNSLQHYFGAQVVSELFVYIQMNYLMIEGLFFPPKKNKKSTLPTVEIQNTRDFAMLKIPGHLQELHVCFHYQIFRCIF